MGKFRDLTGQVFGRLTVIERRGNDGHKRVLWLCKCTCGNLKTTTTGHLNYGDISSCGCLKKELISKKLTKHGKVNTKTYSIRADMIRRCYNIKNQNYEYYGGRGIRVCERWLVSFENFLEDMGECPDGMSLDRIDVNGNYEPGNCRWATIREQRTNTRVNVFIEYEGVRLTLVEWSEKLKIKYSTLQSRHTKGWSPEECLFGRNKKDKSNVED